MSILRKSRPVTGTKTIAHGDLVAIVMDMTARGGADSVQWSTISVTNPLHYWAVDTSADGTFYSAGEDYAVVITAGTVDSVSVVGVVVGTFSIADRPVQALASGSITAAVIATGAIDADAIADNAIDAGAIAADAITAAKIANGAIDAATFAADVDAEILSYIVDDATRIDASALNTATVTTIPAILVDTGTTLDGKIDTIDTNVDSILADTGTDGVVVATANRPKIRKNTALAAFTFLMTDSTNHAPATGLTVTGTRSLDGASFGSCANSVTEIANGWYKIDLAAGDLNADVVALRFTATGADDLPITIVTNP